MNEFFQDSHLVQMVCKDPIEQESMVEELEDKTGTKYFFLADPGSEIFQACNFHMGHFFQTGSSSPLVIVVVNRELFG